MSLRIGNPKAHDFATECSESEEFPMHAQSTVSKEEGTPVTVVFHALHNLISAQITRRIHLFDT